MCGDWCAGAGFGRGEGGRKFVVWPELPNKAATNTQTSLEILIACASGDYAGFVAAR
jgi:hypothetical protein